MKRITSKEFEFLIARKPSPDTRGTYYVIDDKRVRWGPIYTDAADKNSETLRQAREALLQSAAALHVITQSLEGADEPAPESPPPDVVASQEVEPEKPKPFSVLSPE